jgi:hypothetical protein
MSSVKAFQDLLNTQKAAYVIYHNREARLLEVDPAKGLATIDLGQRSANPVVKVSVEELLPSGILHAENISEEDGVKLKDTPDMRPDYGTFSEMVPMRTYNPEAVKDLVVWSDTENGITVFRLWEAYSDYRRGNSDAVSQWFDHPMAGYSLTGVSAGTDPTFYFVFTHDEDKADPDNPQQFLREAIQVRLTRTLLSEKDGVKEWDYDISFAKVEWRERVVRLVAQEGGQ